MEEDDIQFKMTCQRCNGYCARVRDGKVCNASFWIPPHLDPFYVTTGEALFLIASPLYKHDSIYPRPDDLGTLLGSVLNKKPSTFLGACVVVIREGIHAMFPPGYRILG